MTEEELRAAFTSLRKAEEDQQRELMEFQQRREERHKRMEELKMELQKLEEVEPVSMPRSSSSMSSKTPEQRKRGLQQKTRQRQRQRERNREEKKKAADAENELLRGKMEELELGENRLLGEERVQREHQDLAPPPPLSPVLPPPEGFRDKKSKKNNYVELPPPPPVPPPGGFKGQLRYRYVFGERRTFVYNNPSPCEIVYYIGQKIHLVEEPLHECAEDLTFVCFDDCESATRVVERSHRFKMYNYRVSSAKDYIYDAGLNKHLVCFDRFDGFLPQADPTFLSSLKNPNSSYKVPGNPKDVVRCEIKALTEALEYMLSEGVSSSSLHLPIGYVWSQKTSRFRSPGTLKIIMLDVENREDHTNVQWNKIIARDVERFGTGLDKYFLNTAVVWPEKDSFMRCFSMRLLDENRRLPMIRDHQFLKDNIIEIFRMFSRVHRDLRAGDPSDEDVLQYTKLMAAMNGKQFKSEFMPNGEWTRPEMRREFVNFLRGEPLGDSVKYNTKDMGDLLRFQRNLFENYYHSMSLDFMFEEFRKYWPHLIDRFHEKIAALPDRSR